MLVFDSSAVADRLTFAPDNSALVVVWRSGQVDVHALPGGALRHTFPVERPPASWRPVVVHPACRVAFRGGISTSVLDLKTGEVRVAASDKGPEGGTTVSACGGWLVGFRRGDVPLVGFWCTADGDLQQAWEAHTESRYESPGGFVAGGAFVCVDSNRRKLVVRDAATGEVRRDVPYPSFHQGERVSSPDGRRFAAMGYDKLYVWDTRRGNCRPASRPAGGGSVRSRSTRRGRPWPASNPGRRW